jgi:hypothetical protein
MLKYFDDDLNALVATSKKYQKHLCGCFHCGLIWLPKKNVSAAVQNEEQMQELQRCLADLNSWSPTVAELAEQEMEISHGLCTPCYRLKRAEKNRQEQQSMGYYPCYGTANHGHCTQSSCKWYEVCVVDQNELQIWQIKMSVPETPVYVH